MRAFRSLAALGLALAVVAALGAAEPRSRQARMAGNEAEAIADLRDILAAAQAYRASNGSGPRTLQCLGRPQICGFPVNTPPFLDALRGAADFGAPGVLGPDSFASHGYLFTYVAGAQSTEGLYDLGGVRTFTINADPIVLGESGIRYFGVDHTGLMCEDAFPLPNTGLSLPIGCTRL